jgi:hypothetical protein
MVPGSPFRAGPDAVGMHRLMLKIRGKANNLRNDATQAVQRLAKP